MPVLAAVMVIWLATSWLIFTIVGLRRRSVGTVREALGLVGLLVSGLWAGSGLRLAIHAERLFDVPAIARYVPLAGFVQGAFVGAVGALLLFRGPRIVRSLEAATSIVRSVEQRLPSQSEIVGAGLTARERQVVAVILGGLLDNGAIGHRLDISPHTAATHVRNIMAKLGVHSRDDLILLDAPVLESWASTTPAP